MQKLWLKDFEHNISPGTWEAAEDLVAAGRVKHLREVERHFWVGLVETEEDSYEAEVIITPHKIKAYACECFTEGRRLMCPHIAATLLKVRQYIAQQEARKQEKAAAKAEREPQRFTIQAALENATLETLSDFVKDYARKDRDFALAVKTRFAAYLTESENPYSLLLGSALPNAAGKAKVPEADFRRFRKALDALGDQLSAAEKASDLRVAFQISTAMLSKSLPLLPKLDGNRQAALLHFCMVSLQSLTRLNDVTDSPELKEAAWSVCLDLGMKHNLPDELEREMLQFLSASARQDARFQRLNELYDKTPYPAADFVLELFIAALARRDMPEAVVRVLEDYNSLPDTLRSAFLQLYYLKYWEAATHVGEHFLAKKAFSPTQIREIENVLLYMAEQRGDDKRQCALLSARFLQYGNVDTYLQLKKVAGSRWTKEKERLLNALEKNGDRAKIAAVLASEQEWDDLMSLMDQYGDLPMMQRYEDGLMPAHRDFVQGQYVRLLSAYLEEHFGTPAAQHVRARLSQLLQKGETVMVVQIIKDLIAKFPERLSLPAELAELFPKSKRKPVY